MVLMGRVFETAFAISTDQFDVIYDLAQEMLHSFTKINISSLRFHNGLTHFWGPPHNEEKLNYRAIRKQVSLNIIFNE